MNRKFLLLFLLATFLFQSCTIIGLLFGLKSDADKRNSFSSNPDLYGLELGDEVTFILNNRDTVSGQIMKFDTLHSYKFAFQYEGYRMLGRNKIYLPNVNDTISIDSKNHFDRILKSFGDDGIQFYSLKEKKSEFLSYTQFQSIYLKTGEQAKSTDLEDLFSLDEQLWRIKYILISNDIEYAIDSNEIAYFNTDEQYYSWLIGMLLGASVDIILYYTLGPNGVAIGYSPNFGN